MSACGSSSEAMIRGRSAARVRADPWVGAPDVPSAGTRPSRWSAPRWVATCLAYCCSPHDGSSKPRQKVWTGWVIARCIMATTALESTPPDRKAPRGTSEMSRWRVASSRRWRSACTGSRRAPASKVPGRGSQYGVSRRGLGDHGSQMRRWPGRTCRMARIAVRGGRA